MTTNFPKSTANRRWGRAQMDAEADPYKPSRKPAGPVVCRQCGAVYRRGRWQWGKVPAGVKKTLCEACRRTRENYPAGIVSLASPILVAHGDEIEHLIRHQEGAEKADHPLNRVIAIDRSKRGRMEITTTDIHLPRRIMNSMLRAYRGSVSERFEQDGNFVRVEWRRDR
jgi:hypothetical protein